MKHDREFTQMKWPLWQVEIFLQYKYIPTLTFVFIKWNWYQTCSWPSFYFFFIAIKVSSISMLFGEPKIYITTLPLIRIVQYFKRWLNLYLVQMNLFAYIIYLLTENLTIFYAWINFPKYISFISMTSCFIVYG